MAVRRESVEASLLSILCSRREASAPPRVDASNVSWRFIQGVTPSPAQAGSREGFKSDTLFMNARSGREALKCTLPQKTRHKEG